MSAVHGFSAQLHATLSASLGPTIDFAFFLSEPVTAAASDAAAAAAPVPITSVLQLGSKAKVMLWPSSAILAGETEHTTTTAAAFSFVVPSTPYG